VLANGGTDAGLSDLSEPENRYEDSATELLEVYVPVRTPNGTPLLFEAYADERAEVRRLLDLVATSSRAVPTTILGLAETGRRTVS
jgi:hypothetical protein